MSDSVSINIKAPNNQKYVVSVTPSDTILDLKTKIAANCDTPADHMRLIFSGKVLKDPESISRYNISSGHTIHMVRSAPQIRATASTNNPTANIGSIPSPPTTGRSTVPPEALPNPWTAMPFGGGNNRMGINGQDIMGVDTGMLSNMMQDPNFAQYMSSMLQNPQVLQSMLSTNPMLQAMGPSVQQMLHSSQFQQMISNPDTLRQVAQMGPQMGLATPLTSEMQAGPWPTSSPTRTPTVGSPTLSSTAPTAFNPFAGLAGVGTTSPLASQQRQQASEPPEQRFQVQLQQLNEMGFWDAAKNVRALVASNGNLNMAIEILFTRVV
ncbi:hypothetical protein BGZ94_010110 [Podila epigama]|nr:hypothetical protein BGZ94_010110 [Podila epigama]